MAKNGTATPEAPTPGVSIRITETTDLGLAMLIAESEDGQYEPVDIVSSVGEGRAAAREDFLRRLRRLDKGESQMRPYRYMVWARGTRGDLTVACEILDTSTPL